MKTYTCGKCGGEITKEQRDTARKMGGRYWHFECPEDTKNRVRNELTQGGLQWRL